MVKKKKQEAIKPSGKGWLPVLKKVAVMVLQVSTVVLSAPVQLPSKLLQSFKYLALVAGLIKVVEQKESDDSEHGD